MSRTYSVAIVGGTGRLGHKIATVFLDEYRTTFPIIRVLTRNPSTARAQHLADKGAMLQVLDVENVAQSLLEVFIHVDVVINALNVAAPKALKKQVAEAAVKGGAKVFFLSEFGVDHRENDFPRYDHPDWDVKREIASHAREVSRGTPTQVIAVYAGLFTELTLSPLLGYDIDNNIFTCFGPSTQKVTFTSKGDVGRTLARLSTLALEPLASGKGVPNDLRISGDTATYEEIRDMIAEAKGLQNGEIKSEDLERRKNKLRDTSGSHIVEYIRELIDFGRVLMGEGKLDFSRDNANGLVNPADAFWKWKSVADQVQTA